MTGKFVFTFGLLWLLYMMFVGNGGGSNSNRMIVDAQTITPQGVCMADYLLAEKTTQMDENWIRWHCQDADWSWTFRNYVVINVPTPTR